MRDRLADRQHAARLKDDRFAVAECVRHAFRHVAAHDQERLLEHAHHRPEIGAEAVRDLERRTGARIGRNVARMAASNGHYVGTAAVHRKMHGHFERRTTVAGQLTALEVELDQRGFLDQAEGATRRHQDAVGAGNAGADVAKTLDDAEVREHAAGGQHLGPQLGCGRK
jgi:hypothetical protein